MRKTHVDDAQNENRQAERRKAEEAKTLDAVALEFAIHDQVRRRRNKRHHAAYECGKAERHHQTARAHTSFRDA